MTVSNAPNKGNKFTRNPSPQATALERVRALEPMNSKRVFPAAWLLMHIESRFHRGEALVERDGKSWIAQRKECWLTETGLTPRQYRTARTTLKELALVEFRYLRFKRGHRNETTFVRPLVGMARKRREPASTDAGAGSVSGDTHTDVSGDIQTPRRGVTGDTFLKGEKYPRGESEREEFCASAQNNSTINSRKDFEEREQVVEVPKKSSKPKVESAEANTGPKKRVEAAWKRGLEAAGKPAAGFVGPDWKSAADFIAAVGEDRAVEATEIASMFWPEFIKEAEKASQLFDKAIPKAPSFRFLAIHPQAALQFAVDSAPVPVEPISVSVPYERKDDPTTYLLDNPPVRVNYPSNYNMEMLGEEVVPLTPELRKLIDPAILRPKIMRKKDCTNDEMFTL